MTASRSPESVGCGVVALSTRARASDALPGLACAARRVGFSALATASRPQELSGERVEDPEQRRSMLS